MHNKVIISLIQSILIPTILLFTVSSPVIAGDGDLIRQQKIHSHLLINMFLEKVDRGGLTLFGNVISRSDLEPYQVSQVYNLFDDSLVVRLCFKLKKNILVPDFEHFHVVGITAETNPDGNIIQIMTQVSPLSEDKVD